VAVKQDLRRFAPLAYLVGLIALAAMAGWWFVAREFDGYVRLGLAIAVIGLAAGILLDPERVRRVLVGRQVRYGSNALLVSLALVGILIVVNYVAFVSPTQWDLTEDKQYSLTPETVLLLSGLTQPVTLKGFYTPDRSQSEDDIRPLLDAYQAHSHGMLTYEFIDPIENPVARDQYGITTDGSLAVVVGDASEVISFPSEQEISGALVRLANPEKRKVYFLTGEGERDLEATDDQGFSDLKRALESKNYDVATLSLLTDPKIPQDAVAVIVAAPTSPLSQSEVTSLSVYLDAGGGLVVLDEPSVPAPGQTDADPLRSYLDSRWGLRLEDDLVVDLASAVPLAGISTSYGDHPITTRMRNLGTVYPSSRSIEVVPLDDPAITQTTLVLTGDRSWGETDLAAFQNSNQLSFDAGTDKQGPLVLAATAADSTVNSRVVVFGDSDFAANGYFFEIGDGDMVVNSIDWAAGQENLISLTPKASTQRFVVPPSSQATSLIFLLTIILMPGGVVVMGVITWWNRRQRA
jgi:ABC-type uncharacterized transport system involved in gliding motility auxiliary subunit